MKRGLACLLLCLFPTAWAQARVPNDPLFERQWYLERIDAPGAWDRSVGMPTVTVAVLDTGVQLAHPDLRENIWTNPGEIAGNGLDDDLNGFADDVHGWDFVNDDAVPEPDVNRLFSLAAAVHGTAIAGVIGAVGGNGTGVTGISWHVRLMPVRILDNTGSGLADDAARGIRYAVANGAKVINLSFTGTAMTDELEAAIALAAGANVSIVAALGNQSGGGSDLGSAPVFPACYKLQDGRDPVIGVSATDREDRKASFSNFGSGCADVAAPGVDIFSTSFYAPQADDLDAEYLGGWSGTSLATPMVAGTVALVLSRYGSLTPEQLSDILRLSADPLNDTASGTGSIGVGRLNVNRALEIAGQFAATNAPGTPALAAGNLVKSGTDSAVYYVGLDGKRHPFPNSQIYFSWYEDFSGVKTVSAEELASVALGKPVLFRPGTYWVKIQSDPKTYYVEPDGYTLRWVKDEETARRLGGTAWASLVADIEPTYFNKFRFGPDVDGAALATGWPRGALLRAPGETAVWYVDGTERREVVRLTDNDFQSRFVRTLAGAWQNLSVGSPLSARAEAIVDGQKL